MPHTDAGSRLKPRGSSQGGMRQYNERVVLQAVRLNGALSGAEIARVTHLTAQTVSLITKRLLDDGLLIKHTPQRGKVGQPSVPLALNPDGAYGVGIKVGRRSLDVLVIDFAGAVQQRWQLDYSFPDPDAVLAAIAQRLQDIRTALGAVRHARVQGVGIAAPLRMGGWQQLLGVDAQLAARWDGVDLSAAVGRLTALPVQLLKDTAAACVAELVAGRGRNVRSFLYIFVGTFIGGGLVIDSHLRCGMNGNAGAVGSMPMGLPTSASDGAATPPAQLLSCASLLNLEKLYAGAGLDASASGEMRAMQAPWRAVTDRWLQQSAAAIALAIHGAACLLDLDNVIIDGSFERPLLQALLDALQTALNRHDWEGVQRPTVLPGTIGADARALGGALLPLYGNFAPDRELFFKHAAA